MLSSVFPNFFFFNTKPKKVTSEKFPPGQFFAKDVKMSCLTTIYQLPEQYGR